MTRFRLSQLPMLRVLIVVLAAALTFLLGVGIWHTTHQPTTVVDIQLPLLEPFDE